MNRCSNTVCWFNQTIYSRLSQFSCSR